MFDRTYKILSICLALCFSLVILVAFQEKRIFTGHKNIYKTQYDKVYIMDNNDTKGLQVDFSNFTEIENALTTVTLNLNLEILKKKVHILKNLLNDTNGKTEIETAIERAMNQLLLTSTIHVKYVKEASLTPNDINHMNVFNESIFYLNQSVCVLKEALKIIRRGNLNAIESINLESKNYVDSEENSEFHSVSFSQNLYDDRHDEGGTLIMKLYDSDSLETDDGHMIYGEDSLITKNSSEIPQSHFTQDDLNDKLDPIVAMVHFNEDFDQEITNDQYVTSNSVTNAEEETSTIINNDFHDYSDYDDKSLDDILNSFVNSLNYKDQSKEQFPPYFEINSVPNVDEVENLYPEILTENTYQTDLDTNCATLNDETDQHYDDHAEEQNQPQVKITDVPTIEETHYSSHEDHSQDQYQTYLKMNGASLNEADDLHHEDQTQDQYQPYLEINGAYINADDDLQNEDQYQTILEINGTSNDEADDLHHEDQTQDQYQPYLEINGAYINVYDDLQNEDQYQTILGINGASNDEADDLHHDYHIQEQYQPNFEEDNRPQVNEANDLHHDLHTHEQYHPNLEEENGPQVDESDNLHPEDLTQEQYQPNWEEENGPQVDESDNLHPEQYQPNLEEENGPQVDESDNLHPEQYQPNLEEENGPHVDESDNLHLEQYQPNLEEENRPQVDEADDLLKYYHTQAQYLLNLEEENGPQVDESDNLHPERYQPNLEEENGPQQADEADGLHPEDRTQKLDIAYFELNNAPIDEEYIIENDSSGSSSENPLAHEENDNLQGDFILLFNKETSFVDAFTICEEMNMQLATIKSKEEQDKIVALIEESGKDSPDVLNADFWTSGFKYEDLDFAWFNLAGNELSNMTYTNWDHGQPQIHNSPKEFPHWNGCAFLDHEHGYRWSSAQCGETRKYAICESRMV